MDVLRADHVPIDDIVLRHLHARLDPAAEGFEPLYEGSWRYPDGEVFFRLWRQGDLGRLLVDCRRLGQFLIDDDGGSLAWFRDERTHRDVFDDYFSSVILGITLEIRGLLCLHGSCVAVGERAVAFVGGAGAGKSTVASACVREGAHLVTDDVMLVDVSDKGARVRPTTARPRLKLKPDVARVAASERELSSQPTHFGKHWLRAERSTEVPVELARIVLLDRGGDSVELVPLVGHAACQTIIGHSFLDRLIDVLGLQNDRFGRVVSLVQRVAISRLRYPEDLDVLQQVARRVLEEDEG